MDSQPIHHDFLADSQHLRQNERKTFWVMLITGIFMLVEIVMGYWSGSMALLADGWHMGSHTGALAIAWLAYRWARHPEFTRHLTFGAGKLIPLGGYTSAVGLLIVAVMMMVESVARLLNPVPISYPEALGVAAAGLAVNLVSAWILHDHEDRHFHLDRDDSHHDHNHDHNLTSAYWHVIADALTSVFAIVALFGGWYWGWGWLDPLLGLLGSLVIVRWGLQLLRNAGWELLDGHSGNVDGERLKAHLVTHHDVEVLDVHIWRIAPEAYACEIVLRTARVLGAEPYRRTLLSRFNLAHLVVEERLRPAD